MSDNVKEVKRMSIAELLDGRTFFIPDYQRGYRWTSQQVEELLQDLLTFAINKKDTDSYYCLQPIVVRNDVIKNRLEVIDGQQRLTTIKILLHYLRNDFTEEKWKNRIRVGTYKIMYGTREKSNDFIETLNNDNCDVKRGDDEPIDFFFMRNAYKTIMDWFDGKGDFKFKGGSACEICDRLGEVREANEVIRELLVKKPLGRNPTVQVLWYEVDDKEVSIKLFNRLNTGKLELTDAELIKALFLLRTNFGLDYSQQEKDQFQMAVQWERIENALHNDGFWSFLTPRGHDESNRIDLLLRLVYWNVLNAQGKSSEEIEQSLNERHSVFNHYNNIFNASAEERKEKVPEEWEKIENTFSVLEDWYSDPMIYNLVGFVCQTDVETIKGLNKSSNRLTRKLVDIYCKYDSLRKERKGREDFVGYLKELIRKYFADVDCARQEDGNWHIDLGYGDSANNAKVKALLLLLNVDHMNRRASESELQAGELELCKFPFAVLSAQGWDIEHVDSQTTNQLENKEAKVDWIDTSKVDLADEINSKQGVKAEIEKLEQEGNYDELITYLRGMAEENDMDDSEKNNIWNLVLLDAHTNRHYKNALYITKRRKIIERREGGQYVPETTSYVFFKLFEKSAHSKWRWGQDDMQKYANYIMEQLGYDEKKKTGYLNTKKESK